jgi:hypothetical protein
MPNGGYVKENGISVCDDCHLKAEAFWENDWVHHSSGHVEDGFYPFQLFQRINSGAKKALEASYKLESEEQ